MLSDKENALLSMTGHFPESIINYYAGVQILFPLATREIPPLNPGKPDFDSWGVHQTATESAGGMFTPSPGVAPILDDITKWRQLKIPDHSRAAWDMFVPMEKRIFGIDRENFLLDVSSSYGLWERMHLLLGFENAVIALLTEPEACIELVSAIADTKIQTIELAAQYYKPDFFTMLDDYSHKNGLFMAPGAWRQIFKPQLKRVVDAAHENGMRFKLHCCGKCDVLIDDFLELGIDALDPVQPINNVAMMGKKCSGKMGLCGGLDVQHVIDLDGVTEEEVRAEVRRCIDEYGPGGGYIVHGISINAHSKKFGNVTKQEIIKNECNKYGKDFYRKIT